MQNRGALRSSWCSLLILLLAGLVPAAAQEKWLPVTPEELALTSCPQQPGAPAVYLYREEVTRDEGLSVTVYDRLKVLTAAGKEYGTVEVPVFRGYYALKNLKARVVRPGGEAREFSGQVLEKTVLRAGRIKISVKTVALPDIDVGSIIEYRLRYEYDPSKMASMEAQNSLLSLSGGRRTVVEGGFPPAEKVSSWPACAWEIQAPLFTYKARFVYVPYHKGQIYAFGRNMRLAWSSHGLPGGPPEMNGVLVELALQDVPAYEDEEYMAPEDLGQMGVDFFFLDNTVGGADEYWRNESSVWRKGAEAFLRSSPGVAAESERLLAGLTDPLAKLKKLYARAQQVRNLSYDLTLTSQDVKAQGIKSNRSAGEVLNRNYGIRSDITRAFTVLARAAGFTADVARVVSRDDKFFHENLISLYRQFDSEIAVVKTGDQEWFLDPATPFCPFGTIRWFCSDTTLIKTGTETPTFLTSPVSPPAAALTRREINLLLDSSGNLTGAANAVFHGQEALVRRLEHLDDDEATAKKDLEDEMTALLPAGARVTLLNVENLKSSEDEIRARFGISIPDFATQAGGRMLLPASPMQGGRRYPFRHARRVHSVYFSYPYRETDDIIITLPAGMAVESLPAPREHKRQFSEFTLTCAAEEGGKLHVRRDFVIKNSLVPVEQYPVLKSFFDQVRESDEGQAILAPPAKK
jgi:hypothetical protein